MNLTANAIRTYFTCPKKYEFNYIQKLSSAYKGENRALNLSNLSHGILERIISKDERDNSFLLKTASEIANELNISDPEMIEFSLKIIGYYLKDIQFHTKIFKNKLELKQRWEGDDFFVIIDRIDIDDQAMLTLIDYKTGKALIEREEYLNDINIALSRFLVEEKFKKVVKGVLIENLSMKKKYFIGRNEILSYERVKEKLKKYHADLKRSSLHGFEAMPGAHCRFCDFKIICPNVDENIKNIVNGDPILGELYQLNEIIKDMSGILDNDILSEKIIENYKVLTRSKRVTFEILINDKKDEGDIALNNGIEDIAVLKDLDKQSLSMKKQAIVDSYLTQAAIFLNNALLYKKANTDRMTGFYHQSFLKNYMLDLIHKEMVFSVILFDIDHFKKVNDNYGHQTGDIVLKDFASILEKNVRLQKNDIISRYGGEEFMVVLNNIKIAEALNIAERIRIGIQNISFETLSKEKIHITVSGGVNEYPTGGTDMITLIDNCDRALYYSKNNGRNQISVFTEEMK